MRSTLGTELVDRIEGTRGDVFLRADFADLGRYDAVGRALRQLVREGRLLRIGSGLYARARASTIDGAPTPVGSFRDLADEALRRLGIETAPTRFERAYSEGKTTQVPSGRRVAVTKRVRRRISYNGATVSFELTGRRDRGADR